jgi:hypothetical protein
LSIYETLPSRAGGGVMELEKQVCSLDLAKRIKELKVKQDSYFSWIENTAMNPQQGNIYIKSFEFANVDEEEIASAFTTSELGELLPDWTYSQKDYEALESLSPWFCISDGDKYGGKFCFRADTEANVRAKMLCHLIENKLMEAPK